MLALLDLGLLGLAIVVPVLRLRIFLVVMVVGVAVLLLWGQSPHGVALQVLGLVLQGLLHLQSNPTSSPWLIAGE